MKLPERAVVPAGPELQQALLPVPELPPAAGLPEAVELRAPPGLPWPEGESGLAP